MSHGTPLQEMRHSGAGGNSRGIAACRAAAVLGMKPPGSFFFQVRGLRYCFTYHEVRLPSWLAEVHLKCAL